MTLKTSVLPNNFVYLSQLPFWWSISYNYSYCGVVFHVSIYAQCSPKFAFWHAAGFLDLLLRCCSISFLRVTFGGTCCWWSQLVSRCRMPKDSFSCRCRWNALVISCYDYCWNLKLSLLLFYDLVTGSRGDVVAVHLLNCFERFCNFMDSWSF